MEFLQRYFHRDELRNVFLTLTLLNLDWVCLWLGMTVLQSTLVKHYGLDIISFGYVFTIFISIAIYAINSNLSKRIDNELVLSRVSVVILFFLFINLIYTLYVPSTLSWGVFAFAILSINAIFPSIFISRVWNIIGRVFRPARLREIQSIFILAPITGSVFSSLITIILLKFTQPIMLVLVICFLLAVKIILLHRFYVNRTRHVHKEHKQKQESKVNILQSKNLFGLIIAFSFFVFSICTSLLNYEFVGVLNGNYSNSEDMALFLSNFQMIQSVIILLIFLIFKNKILNFVGVFNSFILMSLVCVIGFLIVLLNQGFWEITSYKFAMFLFNFSVFSSANMLSFNVLDPLTRNTTRFLSLILATIGSGVSGILVILLKSTLNPFVWINFIGFLLSIVWLVVCLKGAKVYINTILNNLKNNAMDILECIEDIKNQSLNSYLSKILLDQSSFPSLKIKTLETVARSENLSLLRSVLLAMDDKDFDVRAHALTTIIKLFPKINNSIAKFHIHESVKKILKFDKNPEVRAKAIEFLLHFASSDQLPYIFSEILNTNNNRDERISIFRALKHINNSYVDLLLIEGLKDEDESIQGEVASALYGYPEYKELSLAVVKKLINSNSNEGKISGLKFLAIKRPEVNFSQEIIHIFTAHTTQPFTKVIAGVCLLVNHPGYYNLLGDIVNIVMDKDIFTTQNWRELVELLVDIGDDELIDNFIEIILERKKPEEEIEGMSCLADLMYKRLDLESKQVNL